MVDREVVEADARMALAVLLRAYEDATAAVESIADASEAFRAATALAGSLRRLADHGAELRAKTAARVSVQERMSIAALAQHLGISKARAGQLLKAARAASPELGDIQPAADFLGVDRLTIATPLKQEAIKGRPVVAVEDVAAAQRLSDLARSLGLEVALEHVPVGGDIDLNRSGLVVICGPRLSAAVASVLSTDPVLQFERAIDGPWTLRDRRTGTIYRSGMDSEPATNHDIAYIGRLRRPDNSGSLIAVTGIHPQGTLGAVQILTSQLHELYDQLDAAEFSAIVGVTYDASTHEPTEVEFLTPVYRHQDPED